MGNLEKGKVRNSPKDSLIRDSGGQAGLILLASVFKLFLFTVKGSKENEQVICFS